MSKYVYPQTFDIVGANKFNGTPVAFSVGGVKNIIEY